MARRCRLSASSRLASSSASPGDSLDAGDLSLETACLLRDAGPWGQGFPEPQFEGTFELLAQRVVAERHLKMTVKSPEHHAPLDAIAFSRTAAGCKLGGRLRLVYRLDVNEYRPAPAVQLIVEHLEAC